MGDDLLRLRTARALRWRLAETGTHEDGSRWERYLWRDTARAGYIDYRQDGSASPGGLLRLPQYGTTWASCEEVDAEIKEREWLAQIDMDGNTTRVFLFTSANGLIGTRLSTATAPTFPAAFCEAFCLAVEANDVNAQ